MKRTGEEDEDEEEEEENTLYRTKSTALNKTN